MEVALHVGFGGWSSVDAGVGINEGEILALFFGEPRLARGVTGIGGLIHQSFFQQGGRNGSGRVTPTSTFQH